MPPLMMNSQTLRLDGQSDEVGGEEDESADDGVVSNDWTNSL
jgi:hypothetical protein